MVSILSDSVSRLYRFLLEDGKLNLCLRNLMEFKEFQREQFIAAKSSGTRLVRYLATISICNF
jgi:hypothetical protein